MRLDSAQGLKERLLSDVVVPFTIQASKLRTAGARAVASAAEAGGLARDETVFGVGARTFENLPALQRSMALGIARSKGEYKLAVRVQRPSLLHSPMLDYLKGQAKGEVDVRMIGRIDKRAARRRTAARRPVRARASSTAPWYQLDTRPLLIGASIGHVAVTAGSIGAFVKRANVDYVLSNNHVLANEDQAASGDWVLQRATFDGGTAAARVGRLRHWVRLKQNAANLVDAAMAAIKSELEYDASRLRALVNGGDRKLRGVGPAFVDEGETVYKTGRTTGATEGRVTAFGLDNVIVGYDIGNLRFDDQIEIEGAGDRAFSDGGDSGSLIVNSEMKAIALLFAGGDIGGSNGQGLTYANPIQRVLSDLKATLLF